MSDAAVRFENAGRFALAAMNDVLGLRKSQSDVYLVSQCLSQFHASFPDVVERDFRRKERIFLQGNRRAELTLEAKPYRSRVSN